MQITVNFFSYAKQAGKSECVYELSPGATLADLTRLLAERLPLLFPAANAAIYLVNRRTGARDTLLSDGDQVIMLQVISGG